VSSAGSGLKERGINISEVLDLEDTSGWFEYVSFSIHDNLLSRSHTRVSAVLGETTVHRDTVGLEMLAEQLLAAAAVEAFSAKLRVVGNDTLPDLETLDLGANGSNHTNSLVAYEDSVRQQSPLKAPLRTINVPGTRGN
jgi:hypothetical protein